MKRNIGAQESNMRMLAGGLIILFAMFVVDIPSVKIVLATLAAILAGTAFLRYCPINTLLKRDTSDEVAIKENEIEEKTPTEVEDAKEEGDINSEEVVDVEKGE